MRGERNHALAGIQYSGLSGISCDCQHAVQRLLQYGDRITRVRILSCRNDHSLLLTVNVGELVAIKSGFASGYAGEGPSAFSYVLQLLDAVGADIKEYEVAPDLIERLDSSALTKSDVKKLDDAVPVRPTRWHGYVFEKDFASKRSGTLWRGFPALIPFAVIDSRIIDLAISFWEGPDERLLTGYRRLEDIVRKRAGIDAHGAKLFSQAFEGPTAKLGWGDRDNGESIGRALLFKGSFLAHRNPRAHREVEGAANDQLAEFLLLNHLYCLEKNARVQDGKGSS